MTDLDPAIGLVTAQRIQIDQVIVNLLRNAIDRLSKQIAARGEIRILTRMDAPKKWLSLLLRIPVPVFVRRQRGSCLHLCNHQVQRNGVGLSISLGIIKAHDGNLYQDTEPGAGAVFRFTLPVSAEDEIE